MKRNHNEQGQCIGEGHPRAKVSDADVDRIRAAREDVGATYAQILDWWAVSKSWVARVCRYEIRAQTPVVESGAHGGRRRG